MGLISKLLGRVMRPEHPGDWKYIGKAEFITNVTDDDTGKPVRKIHHMACMYMTDDGRRRVEYVSSNGAEYDYALDRHPYKMIIEAWVRGDKFPSSFEPAGDTLGEMLTRLVSQKLEEVE